MTSWLEEKDIKFVRFFSCLLSLRGSCVCVRVGEWEEESVWESVWVEVKRYQSFESKEKK